VEVFDDDADEHVEDEEPDEQQERDEVDETPFVEVLARLRTKKWNLLNKIDTCGKIWRNFTVSVKSVPNELTLINMD
jgi:hypothetical protein